MNTQPEDLETFVDRTTKMLELARLEGAIRSSKKKLNEWDPDEAYAVAHLEKAAADVRFARLAVKRKRSRRG